MHPIRALRSWVERMEAAAAAKVAAEQAAETQRRWHTLRLLVRTDPGHPVCGFVGPAGYDPYFTPPCWLPEGHLAAGVDHACWPIDGLEWPPVTSDGRVKALFAAEVVRIDLGRRWWGEEPPWLVVENPRINGCSVTGDLRLPDPFRSGNRVGD